VDDGWLAIVRIARDCGDVSSLLPAGVRSLYDAPYLFVEAVKVALFFLSFEELAVEERPPKRIWLDNDKMAQWWADVKASRDAKYKGRGDYQSMPENQALRDIFKGRGFRG
jgi:hypothetical protein